MVAKPSVWVVIAASSWRPTLTMLLLAATGGVVLGIGAVAVLRWPRQPLAPASSAPVPPAATAASGRPEGAIPTAPAPPSFDVVRIARDGQTVIAGRAAPGAEVSIRDQGKIIGQTQADAQGNWVFVPPAPLPAGTRELTLNERVPGGAKGGSPGGVSIAGTGSAVLVVPGATATPAIALLATPNAAPRVLQAPGKKPGKLALDAVEYGEAGEVRLGGSAPPGAIVRVYVDNTPIGEARAEFDRKLVAGRSGGAGGDAPVARRSARRRRQGGRSGRDAVQP